MKTKIILLSVAFATALIFSCNSEAKKDIPASEQPNKSVAAVSYVCPMHPEIKSDKPAQCSECGMDLEAVEKKDSVKH